MPADELNELAVMRASDRDSKAAGMIYKKKFAEESYDKEPIYYPRPNSSNQKKRQQKESDCSSEEEE